RTGARSRRYVRCGNSEENYYYAQVACLFTVNTTVLDETFSLALVQQFCDVDYPQQIDEDEYCGRVIPLRSRSLQTAKCIKVEDIQCAVGIVHNSYTGGDYIVDRNWDMFNFHEDAFDRAAHDTV
ncbi:hypothetical protein V1523DRAFT_123632, partial [Lipomyces doorenjongii]